MSNFGSQVEWFPLPQNKWKPSFIQGTLLRHEGILLNPKENGNIPRFKLPLKINGNILPMEKENISKS